MSSKSTVIVNRWTHLAVVLSESTATLFVNGLQDDSIKLTPTETKKPIWVTSKDDLYLGSHPSPQVSGANAFLDEVRVYSVKKSTSFLKSHGSIAFYGIPSSSDFVFRGCSECTRAEAAIACGTAPKPQLIQPKEGGAAFIAPGSNRGLAHICTQNELAAGGMTVARVMGWFDNLNPKSKVFVYEESETDSLSVKGLAVCCYQDQ